MVVRGEHVVHGHVTRVEADADEVGVRGVHVHTHHPAVSLEGELRVRRVLQTKHHTQTQTCFQKDHLVSTTQSVAIYHIKPFQLALQGVYRISSNTVRGL